MPLDKEIQDDHHNVRHNLPKFAGYQNQQVHFSFELFLECADIAPSGDGKVAVTQVTHHQQREADYDRDDPTDNVEDGEQLLDQDYFIVDEGEIEVDGETASPEEGTHGGRRGYEALDLAEVGESDAPLGVFIVDGVVERAHDIAKCSEEVGNGEVSDDGSGPCANVLPPGGGGGGALRSKELTGSYNLQFIVVMC